MRAVYFDCFAGVSGDMIIGAQLDLGVDLGTLTEQLASLDLSGYGINSRRVERSSISAVKFDVKVDESKQPARVLDDIRSIIDRSKTADSVKRKSVRVFERLAEAEARVHGTTPEKIHFHEVGAVDSIIDIVGAMIGFELLRIERFFCSSLRLGNGMVATQHGLLPIPAPATAELLVGVPTYAGDLEGEFVTPTGAAIVRTLCESFGEAPQITVESVGYGAGKRDPKAFPNALRLMMGEIENTQAGTSPDAPMLVKSLSDETIMVLETNIDDMNPQVYGFVMERAFSLGALEVFTAPIQMKKGRPGVLLTVLCNSENLDTLIEMLVSETTTLGVRYYEAKRRVLERQIETVETEYGRVRIKVARDSGRTLHFQPEYEDCARLALVAKVPLIEVQAAAATAYRNRRKVGSIDE
jgi:uncharacterized protein (TIGR00299 family) protein